MENNFKLELFSLDPGSGFVTQFNLKVWCDILQDLPQAMATWELTVRLPAASQALVFTTGAMRKKTIICCTINCQFEVNVPVTAFVFGKILKNLKLFKFQNRRERKVKIQFLKLMSKPKLWSRGKVDTCRLCRRWSGRDFPG